MVAPVVSGLILGASISEKISLTKFPGCGTALEPQGRKGAVTQLLLLSESARLFAVTKKSSPTTTRAS